MWSLIASKPAQRIHNMRLTWEILKAMIETKNKFIVKSSKIFMKPQFISRYCKFPNAWYLMFDCSQAWLVSNVIQNCRAMIGYPIIYSSSCISIVSWCTPVSTGPWEFVLLYSNIPRKISSIEFTFSTLICSSNYGCAPI